MTAMAGPTSGAELHAWPYGWMPTPVRILSSREENFNARTFELQIVDEALRSRYVWTPGQFNMVWVPGLGEAAISISSDPAVTDRLSHTIRNVGTVTRAVMRMDRGGVLGLRGPFGHGWPMDELPGRDVVIVAGGIGLAPLRPVLYWILRNRSRCRRIVLLYGVRAPGDRLYVDELEAWGAKREIDVLMTVDQSAPGWVGTVGIVTKLLQRVRVNAERAIVLVCGPRMMNRVAAWSFLQLHVPPEQVYVSLERNMNCGFGRCGHCQYGAKFVCVDGPVFRFSDIATVFAKDEV